MRRPLLIGVSVASLAAVPFVLAPAGAPRPRAARLPQTAAEPRSESTGRRSLLALVPVSQLPTDGQLLAERVQQQRASRSATRVAPTRPPVAQVRPRTEGAQQRARTPTPTASERRASTTSRKLVRTNLVVGRDLGVHDVTSYCLRGTMANGRQVHAGAIATISRAIPFGTRLLIDGRVYTVEDRIGAGSDFDVWLPSCALSLQWGRRRLQVVVVNG